MSGGDPRHLMTGNSRDTRSRHMWLPGVYATRQARAARAFQFSNYDLDKLQRSRMGERPITTDNLRERPGGEGWHVCGELIEAELDDER